MIGFCRISAYTHPAESYTENSANASHASLASCSTLWAYQKGQGVPRRIDHCAFGNSVRT